MDTSELFADIGLLSVIISVIVVVLYYVRLRINPTLRGFGKLRLERDPAKVSEPSQAARRLLKRLTNPPPQDRQARMVAEFMMACDFGQLENVRRLMNRGVHPNARRARGGKTGLMLAAQNGHFEVVNDLLKRGADVNAAGGRSGKTALIRASEAGHIEIAKVLIRAGARVDARSTVSGKTALMGAVQYGNLSVVMLLLQEGADVDARNKNGDTALGMAVEAGLEDLAALLRAFRSDFGKHDKEVRTQLDQLDIDVFYAVLNSKKTDSMEQIRAKYRSLIKQYHPDVIQGKGLPADFVEFANRKFQEIRAAYEYINKRASTRNSD